MSDFRPLPPTIWYTPTKTTSSPSAAPQFITVHHLILSAASAVPGLLPALHKEYAEELARGTTFPQEGLDHAPVTRDAFEAYFFAADVCIGILGASTTETLLHPGDSTVSTREFQGVRIRNVDISIEAARAGRAWEDCIAGFYYIRPYLPGRSSHLCNGGIVVTHAQRSNRLGTLLTRSYLHYAPSLGYRASVFLAYANNIASLSTLESLKFTKVGRIPSAGRVRRADGRDEEYVDGWVIYKDFLAEQNRNTATEAEVSRGPKAWEGGRDEVATREYEDTRAGWRSIPKL